jgi:hypothetical protein
MVGPNLGGPIGWRTVTRCLAIDGGQRPSRRGLILSSTTDPCRCIEAGERILAVGDRSAMPLRKVILDVAPGERNTAEKNGNLVESYRYRLVQSSLPFATPLAPKRSHASSGSPLVDISSIRHWHRTDRLPRSHRARPSTALDGRFDEEPSPLVHALRRLGVSCAFACSRGTIRAPRQMPSR